MTVAITWRSQETVDLCQFVSPCFAPERVTSEWVVQEAESLLILVHWLRDDHRGVDADSDRCIG